MTMTEPRIYVADLAAYNEGKLVGSWINLEDMTTADELHEAIESLVLIPGHEEWAIHDYEGFGSIQISEYESLERVAMLAQKLIEDAGKFEAWISAKGESSAEDFDEDKVRGPYATPDEWLDNDIEGMFGTLDLEDILTKAGIGHLYNYVEWRDAESYQRNVTGSPTGILTEVRTGKYSVEYYEVDEV